MHENSDASLFTMASLDLCNFEHANKSGKEILYSRGVRHNSWWPFFFNKRFSANIFHSSSCFSTHFSLAIVDISRCTSLKHFSLIIPSTSFSKWLYSSFCHNFALFLIFFLSFFISKRLLARFHIFKFFYEICNH